MKNNVAITLVLSTLLLMAACSAPPSPEPPAASSPANSPSPDVAAALPKPDRAEQEALLTALAKINPGLSSDQAVGPARRLCGRLLGQSSEDQLITAAKTEFSTASLQAISDGDARRILSVIGSNGFCR